MSEIVKTRMGNLGSSDARIVYNVGKTGEISAGTKVRIAQMLGYIKIPEFKNKYTERGHQREEQFYNEMLNSNPNAKLNPLFVSTKIVPVNFSIINHIDVEVYDNLFKSIKWYECKSTETHSNIDEVIETYKYQLQWHMMLLEEKAEMGSKSHELYLVWFDEVNSTSVVVRVKRDDEIIDTLKKGISIIDEWCTNVDQSKFALEEVELDMERSDTPIKELYKALVEIENINKRVEEFKEQLKTFMLQFNIKSVKNDYLNITLVDESTQVTIDTSKLKREFPDVAKQVEKIVRRKPYVKITLKKNEDTGAEDLSNL